MAARFPAPLESLPPGPLLKAKASAVLDEVSFLVFVHLVHVAISLMTRLPFAGADCDSTPSLVGDCNWSTKVLAVVLPNMRNGVLRSCHIDCDSIQHFHIKPLDMDANKVLAVECGSTVKRVLRGAPTTRGSPTYCGSRFWSRLRSRLRSRLASEVF